MEKIYVIIKEDVNSIVNQHVIMGYTNSEHEAKKVIKSLHTQLDMDVWSVYYYEEINKINMG